MESDKEIGLVGQAFGAALKNELSEFYRLLATLEAQASDEAQTQHHSLHHLSVWTLEPTNRMKLLLSLVEACRGLRGGALISAIYSFLHHGDDSR